MIRPERVAAAAAGEEVPRRPRPLAIAARGEVPMVTVGETTGTRTDGAPPARTARKVVEDPVLEESLREWRTSAVPPEALRCDDATHEARWCGLQAYRLRTRLGFTRADVVERLHELGIPVTSRTLARWEHGADGDEPSFSEARALCGILGVEHGDVVDCGECWYAAYVPTLPPEEIRAAAKEALAAGPGPLAAGVQDRAALVFPLLGRRFAEIRRERGLSVRALARAANVRGRDLALIERGAWGCVRAEVALDVADVLQVAVNFREGTLDPAPAPVAVAARS